MVLTKVPKCWVEVMDPADGRFYWHSRESFRKRWTGVLVLLAPGDSFEAANRKTSIDSRFWRLIRPHRWALRQAFFGAAAETVLPLAGLMVVPVVGWGIR